jgi:hypothetical protein
MQQNVIQNAAQRVFGVWVLGSNLDGLGNSDTQRAVGLRVLRQNGRPDSVLSLGLGATDAPNASIRARR